MTHMTERNRLQIYFGNVEIRFPLRRKSETMANCDLNCSLSSTELNMLHVMTFAKISQKKKTEAALNLGCRSDCYLCPQLHLGNELNLMRNTD